MREKKRQGRGAIEVEGGGVRYKREPGMPDDPLVVTKKFKDAADNSLITPIMGKIVRKIALTADELELFEEYKAAIDLLVKTQPTNPNAGIRQQQLEIVGEPTLQDPVGFED